MPTASNPLTAMRAPRAPVPWEPPARGPKEATTDRVWIGADPNGLGFEVAVADWSGTGGPTQEALRTLHAARLRARAIPLCVAVRNASGRTWILGPVATMPVLGPIPDSQAARLLQAALLEPSAMAARARILQARDALETAEIPGFDSQGLFATHQLTWGVPRRPDWATACEQSRALMAMAPRGADLVRGLGFDSHGIAGNALLLTVGGEPPTAVAILLRDDETFDAESPRFGKSPIYHGLDIARRNNVRWLVVARGSQLRLYPTSSDVGVGRRGATQTYFGLDLALLDEEHAGYLSLTFSGSALAAGGSADQILDESRDYAVLLGERLRERVYEKVVDSLSTAIARALAVEATLDEARLALAYRLTLRILFRLLFQAYAEDTRLLPLHRNERYTRASLKELARDLAAHPERPNDPHSTSLWDGLGQVWRVIDSGDEAWGVPAYNGGLFGSDPELHPDGAAIARLTLHNDAVGPALAGLLVDIAADGDRGPVDFRSLDVRDFGTIYEGLLESGLSLAPDDLTVDEADSWRPAKAGERVEVAKGSPYFHSKSGDRKATGSYFTRPFAVEHLLKGALDPALDAHLDNVAALVGKGDQVGAARLLFDFRVADLAMGSGHFLVAAIAHIEAKYGAFLERNPIPGVERELLELRDAALAALARVGVDEPEIDRSALLGRQIARRCVYGLDINEIAVELARLAIWVRTFVPGLPMSSLDHQLVCGNSLTGIGTVDEAIDALDPNAGDGALTFSGVAIQTALDGARVVLEDAAALKESTSEETRAAQEAANRALEAAEPARLLFDAAVAVRLGVMAPPAAFDAEGIARGANAARVQDALRALDPAHFPARFPEVFLRDRPGFDVVLGNPPWDELHVNADKFWVRYFPGHMSKSDGEKERLRAQYAAARPDLAQLLAQETAMADKIRDAIKAAFHLGAGGDLYRAFCYRYLQVVRPLGSLGVVLPRSASIGASHGDWRKRALEAGHFVEVFNLTNKRGWAFEGVHPQYQIVLVSWRKESAEGIAVRGTARSLAEFSAAANAPALVLSKGALSRIAPGSGIPAMPAPGTHHVFEKFLRMPRMSDMTSSMGLEVGFDGTAGDVRALRRVDPSTSGALQVIQGRHIDQWTPVHGEEWVAVKDRLSYPLADTRGIVYRQLARSDDQRTFRVALAPAGTLVKETGYWILTRSDPELTTALLAWLSSRTFDWYVRTVVDRRILPSLALMLPVPDFTTRPDLRDRLVQIGDLLLTLGTSHSDLLAESDAICALYAGLDADDLELLLKTFHPTWQDDAYVDAAKTSWLRWETS